MSRQSTIRKLQQHPFFALVLNPHELLVKTRGPLRHQVDQLIQKPRSMHARRHTARPNLADQLTRHHPPVSARLLHPVAKIEKPALLLGRREIRRLAPLVPCQDGRVEQRHRPQRIGPQAHAGADLGECGRGLIDVYPDVVVNKGDGEAETANAAAGDGDGEGFGLGRG